MRILGSMVIVLCIALTAAGESEEPEPGHVVTRDGERPTPVVAIDNVCAWPNLTVLADGTVVATIHNQPSHLRLPSDVECWAGADGGRTWEKRGTPAPRDTEHTARGNVAAGVAANGDLLVLASGWSDPVAEGRGEILKTWVSRSADGGRTWSIDRDVFPLGPEGLPLVPFGDILQGGDGHLRVAAYRSNRTHVYISRDDGRTWDMQSTLAAETDSNETALFHLGAGRWLAAARFNGLELYYSDDDAETWTPRGTVTGPSQHPGHLMRFGTSLLLTYGNRTSERGVDVRFSDDEGRTWSEPFRVLDFQGDGGYPSSVALPDGQVLTAYYAKSIAGHDNYHMGVAIWDPARTRGR